MRLNFGNTPQNDENSKQSSVALNSDDNHRVEIHIKDNQDNTFTLIALSGIDKNLPTKTVRQGPFYTYNHARSAQSAINNELLRTGFVISSHPPIWEINAQGIVSEIREAKQKNRMNYKFDPKDVYLDHNF
jgi:hypothetical protein